MDTFGTFLRGFDGGNLSNSTVEQYKLLVQQLFGDAGVVPSYEQLRSLSSPGGTLQLFRACHFVSTVKKLLVAVKHYTSFLMCSGEITESQASTLRNVISQGMFSLRKELSARRTELLVEQGQNLSAIQQAMDHYPKSRFCPEDHSVL